MRVRSEWPTPNLKQRASIKMVVGNAVMIIRHGHGYIDCPSHIYPYRSPCPYLDHIFSVLVVRKRLYKLLSF